MVETRPIECSGMTEASESLDATVDPGESEPDVGRTGVLQPPKAETVVGVTEKLRSLLNRAKTAAARYNESQPSWSQSAKLVNEVLTLESGVEAFQSLHSSGTDVLNKQRATAPSCGPSSFERSTSASSVPGLSRPGSAPTLKSPPQSKNRCKAEIAFLSKFAATWGQLLPLRIAIEDRESRRELVELRRQFEKHNAEKVLLLEKIKDLHKERKSLRERHLWQAKNATAWKKRSTEFQSQLSNLDFVYDYVALCDGMENGNLQKYTGGTLAGEIRVAQGMHAALATLMRKNREFHMKVVHEERERESSIKKLRQLSRTIYSTLHRSPHHQDSADTAPGPPGTGQIARRGAVGGALDSVGTSGDAASRTQNTLCDLDQSYKPLSPAWHDEDHWDLTQEERKDAISFMALLVASSGYFPFDFLNDLRKNEQNRALEALSFETVALWIRLNSLESTFQKLQDVQYIQSIEEVMSYCDRTMARLLNCERASIWVVDEARGILWTKDPWDDDRYIVSMFDKNAERGTATRRCRSSQALQGFLGYAVRSKMVVVSNDARNDPRRNDDMDIEFGSVTRNVACVPIMLNKKPVAVVEAVNRINKKGFNDLEIFMMGALGNRLSDKIRGFMKKEQDRQMDKRKEALISASGELFLHCTSMADLLRFLDGYLEDLFCSHKATIVLLYGDYVSRLQVDPHNKDKVLEITAQKTDGLVGVCLHQKAPVHANHFLEDPRYDGAIDLPGDPERDAECAIHCWPLFRGRLLSAIVQWISPLPSLVDFGDSDTFSHVNVKHAEFLNKIMVLVSNYVELWYPAIERLQSETNKNVRKKLRVVMAMGGFRRAGATTCPNLGSKDAKSADETQMDIGQLGNLKGIGGFVASQAKQKTKSQ